MKSTLSTRLFFSYLLVLLVGVIVLAIVAQLSLPGAYGRHLGRMAEMMGMGTGRVLLAEIRQNIFINFRSSFFEALAWASMAAMIVALVVSMVMSKSISAPLHEMMLASQKMTEGSYKERVEVNRNDELGQLATSFNLMAEKLEQVESMRRRLIGDVAHELRTPLTTIKGSMEGLVDGVLPANVDTYEQVAVEVDRLSRLVDDLQELSRVEAGAIHLEFKPTSLYELIETAQKRQKDSFTKKGISLNISIPPGLHKIRADADRLLQVLTNLFDNALRYTPNGGTVVVSAEESNKETVIRITDTGVGISQEYLKHIFDRFFRVDKSRSRQTGGGSGIGLTICKYIVEAHGGRIWAESKGEGQGSTFFFTVPKF